MLALGLFFVTVLTGSLLLPQFTHSPEDLAKGSLIITAIGGLIALFGVLGYVGVLVSLVLQIITMHCGIAALTIPVMEEAAAENFEMTQTEGPTSTSDDS